MINIDFKNYFHDRIWFGWWYRGWSTHGSILAGEIGGWCRDPDAYFGIYTLEEVRNGKYW